MVRLTPLTYKPLSQSDLESVGSHLTVQDQGVGYACVRMESLHHLTEQATRANHLADALDQLLAALPTCGAAPKEAAEVRRQLLLYRGDSEAKPLTPMEVVVEALRPQVEEGNRMLRMRDELKAKGVLADTSTRKGSLKGSRKSTCR